MDWLDWLVRNPLNARVVHRLPGRLRVHVPALRQLAPDQRPLAETVRPFLLRLRGIRGVDPSLETGNVLIHYDPAVVTESDILACWHDVAHFIKQHRGALQALRPEQISGLVERLAGVLALSENDGTGRDQKTKGLADAAR